VKRGNVDPTIWKYGLLIDKSNLPSAVHIRQNKIQKYPFSDVGDLVYDNGGNAYVDRNHEAPLVLSIKAQRIPEWGLQNNSAGVPPKSPIISNENI
jgi:hypothetical protein